MASKKPKIPERFYGYKHWTLEEVPRQLNVGKGLKSRAESTSRNHKWHAIVKRYGLRVEICIGPVTNEEACAWEIATIAETDAFTTNHSHDDPTDIRCNFTRGGDGLIGYVQKYTDERREKLRLTFTGLRVGSHHPMFGKTHALSSLRKMSLETSGEKNGRAKLTTENVKEIRAKYCFRKVTKQMLAQEYDVYVSTIIRILDGSAWKSVK